MRLDYFEIYHIDFIVGYIGQDTNGKIYVKGKNTMYKRILNSFIIPITVNNAIVEGSMSFSTKTVMLTDNPDWINYLKYNLPPEYYTSQLMFANKKEFDELGY